MEAQEKEGGRGDSNGIMVCRSSSRGVRMLRIALRGTALVMFVDSAKPELPVEFGHADKV